MISHQQKNPKEFYLKHFNTQLDESGASLLHYAVSIGDLDGVRTLIECGLNVNNKDKNGSTPLMEASQLGFKDIVELLIANHANKDQQNNEGASALYLASQNGHFDIVELLLKNKANTELVFKVSSSTPLAVAIFNHHNKIAKLLMAYGASTDIKGPNGNTLLHVALSEGEYEIANLLIEEQVIDINAIRRDGITALIQASHKGQLNVVKNLIEHGATINLLSPYTALCYAASEGHLEIVNYLLDKGAIANLAKAGEFFPIFMAAQNGYKEVLFALLKAGVDVNEDNSYSTPLYVAAQNGHDEVVLELLKNGAMVDKGLPNGLTPLMAAAGNGHCKTMEILIEHGANISTYSPTKATALSIAIQEKKENAVKFLIDHGSLNNLSVEEKTDLINYAKKNYHFGIIGLLTKTSKPDSYDISFKLDAPMDNKTYCIAYEKLYKTFLIDDFIAAAKLLKAMKSKAIDVNLPNLKDNNKTLLHYAVIHKSMECIKLLLKNEADLNARDCDGKTPIDYAGENLEIKKLLTCGDQYLNLHTLFSTRTVPGKVITNTSDYNNNLKPY